VIDFGTTGPDAGSTHSALAAILCSALHPEFLQAFGAGESRWFSVFGKTLVPDGAGVRAESVRLAFRPDVVTRLTSPQDAAWFAVVQPDVEACLSRAEHHIAGLEVPKADAPPALPMVGDPDQPDGQATAARPPLSPLTLATAVSTDAAAKPDSVSDDLGPLGEEMSAHARELAAMPTPPPVSPKQQAHLERMRETRMGKKKAAKVDDPTSFIVEAHGHSVQVVRKANGTFHRRHAVFVRDAKTGALNKEVRQRSLDTSDRAVARGLAVEFLRRVAAEKRGMPLNTGATQGTVADPADTGGQTSVMTAVERYVASEDMERLTPKTQSSYRSALAALTASLGPETALETVGRNDLKRHCEARLAPGFRYRPVDRNGHWGRVDIIKATAVTEGTVNADLTTFAILWNWCARTTDGRGEPLVRLSLPVMPRLFQNDDAHRPSANPERSERLIAFLDALIDDLESQIRTTADMTTKQGLDLSYALRRALFARVGIVLAGLYGVRRGSIASLAWENVDLEGTTSDDGPQITFLLKNTSGGRPIRHRVLIPKDELPMVSLLLNTVGSQGASPYVFPKATNVTRHVTGDELGAWLDGFTERAGLLKQKGGIWHPFRRGWAQALLAKGWDAQQVAKYGGWRDLATFHKSYALRLPETEKAMIHSTPMAQLLARRESGGAAVDSPAADHPAEAAMTQPTKRGAMPRNVPQSGARVLEFPKRRDAGRPDVSRESHRSAPRSRRDD
jgi:integrase